MRSASNPHAFMGVTENGLAAIVKTRGNKDVHVILRGGTKGPNYKSEFVRSAADVMTKSKASPFPSVMVDCSHGNSSKNHNNQPLVVDDICTQLAAGERSITGVMIESNINAGRQDIPAAETCGTDPVVTKLKHGVSVTDACVDWAMTIDMLDELNEAVKARRTLIVEQGIERNGVKHAAIERLQNGL